MIYYLRVLNPVTSNYPVIFPLLMNPPIKP
nr:MAG TPA: hypothetical protein [Bacteriophage sp.]